MTMAGHFFIDERRLFYGLLSKALLLQAYSLSKALLRGSLFVPIYAYKHHTCVMFVHMFDSCESPLVDDPADTHLIVLMAISSYYNQAEVLVRDYLFSSSFIPYTSVIVGVLMCKMSYDLTQLISSFYLKRYAGLSKTQRVEWNNRGISTVHAIFITVMSIYFVFFSNLFSGDHFASSVTLRSSPLSAFTLGVSVGYFITDLGMIIWQYPSLGGMEYVFHHLLSLVAVAYSILSGEGQLYTFMVLISETTTPAVNLRWYLDTAGMKRSSAYLVNGVIMFVAWLVARILLFAYLFYHAYLHYDQVEQMHAFGFYLAFIVPSVLAIMNIVWFWKIIKGLKKTLEKRH